MNRENIFMNKNKRRNYDELKYNVIENENIIHGILEETKRY